MQRDALATCVLALMLTLPRMASAADAAAPQSPQAQPAEEQLDEVIVTGQRSHPRDSQKTFTWLARLVGQFTIDGYVDPQARGNPEDFLKVQGRADCAGFGIGPGVQYALRVRWPERKGPNGEEIPGVALTLDPAVMLFGFDQADLSIRHILVDNKGVAEDGVGNYLNADTVLSRSPCVAIPANCERVVRITASPDLQTVEMRIELEVDHHKAVGYDIVMHRVPGSESVVYGRKPEKENQ